MQAANKDIIDLIVEMNQMLKNNPMLETIAKIISTRRKNRNIDINDKLTESETEQINNLLPIVSLPTDVSVRPPAPVSVRPPAPVSVRPPAPVSVRPPAPVSVRPPAPVPVTPAPVPVPNPPKDLIVVPNDKSVIINWTASTPNENIISKYIVENNKGVKKDTVATNINFDNLINGEKYTFEVYAVGTDNKESAKEKSPEVIPFGKPNSPKNLQVEIGDSEITLKWEEPDLNGKPIVGYSIDKDNKNLIQNIVDRTYKVSGLTNDQEYTFDVYSYDGTSSSDKISIKAIPKATISTEDNQTPAEVECHLRHNTFSNYKNDDLKINLYGMGFPLNDPENYKKCFEFFQKKNVLYYLNFHTVNIKKEEEEFKKICSDKNCKYISIKVHHYRPPTVKKLLDLWVILDEFNERYKYSSIKENKKYNLVMHCTTGHGRTGFMLCSYIWYRKILLDPSFSPINGKDTIEKYIKDKKQEGKTTPYITDYLKSTDTIKYLMQELDNYDRKSTKEIFVDVPSTYPDLLLERILIFIEAIKQKIIITKDETINSSTFNNLVQKVKHEEKNSHQGLNNLGNTCYLNSYVQMLSYVPEFIEELITYKDEAVQHDNTKIRPFKIDNIYYQTYYNDVIDIFNKLYLTSIINIDNPIFYVKNKDGKQHDVEEAITKFFDRINLKLEYFNYLQVSKSTCDNGNNISETKQKQPILNLEIADTANNISDLITNFQVIQSVNDWKDEENKCKEGKDKIQNIKKNIKIEIPNENKYLIIQLKRYNYDFKVQPPVLKKIKKNIELGQIEVDSKKYELYGVIRHIGINIDGGHYIFSKINGSDVITYDDNSVTSSTYATEKDNLEKEGYIIIYKRNDSLTGGHTYYQKYLKYKNKYLKLKNQVS